MCSFFNIVSLIADGRIHRSDQAGGMSNVRFLVLLGKVWRILSISCWTPNSEIVRRSRTVQQGFSLNRTVRKLWSQKKHNCISRTLISYDFRRWSRAFRPALYLFSPKLSFKSQLSSIPLIVSKQEPRRYWFWKEAFISKKWLEECITI